MKAAHLRAAFPELYRVLGLPLRPLSIGHYMLLENEDSPFVSEIPRQAEEKDLIRAVAICAQTYEKALESLNTEAGARRLTKWITSLYPGLCFWRKPVDWEWKYILFADYVQRSIEAPKAWIEKGQAESPGAHWTETLLVSLMSLCGHSESEALNTPVTLGWRRVCTYWEIQRGRRILYSKQDEENREFARKCEEERAHG